MSIAPITPTNNTQVTRSRMAKFYDWIPESWYAIDNGRGDRTDRDRGDRDREDLDDTRSFRRRYDDNIPPAPKIQVPFGVIVTVVIFTITQLVGGVWWGATLSANLQHEIADRAKEEGKLWDQVNTYRSEVNALRIEIARATRTSNRDNRQED